ncbi:16S rRNA (cytosine(1402)-N(4))-methyltransferase RsmH [Yunchengibacter salinarum]|uniref:16S rRNA (cytosine(1402)-N(4))-methyltransferase RsmH n=1 Tax=Yunchengibacter salinarum TaxID=3133399 RepID=UPI0035B626BC
MSAIAARGNHVPVLRDAVVRALAPAEGERHVDGTFGAGGYARALLDAAPITLYAIDRDPDAAPRAATLRAEAGERFHFLPGRFSEMDRLVAEAGGAPAHGVALDIGVSSFQLDEAERGFSFSHDGPLDMRMSREGESAADVVNSMEEGPLADLIYTLGEERASRRVARAIVAARDKAPISRTAELADIVARAMGGRRPPRKGGGKVIHPATRTFQALRIHVNDELGELDRGLEAAERLLAPGGRLAVVSFHSLEDRRVKTFMAERSGRTPSASRHRPDPGKTGPAPTFHLAKKGTIKPDDAECAANPRARSARLRVAIRTDAPARGQGGRS